MWTELTEEGLHAALAAAEAEAFRRSAGAGADPVAEELANTAAFVRGCVRSGGRAAVPPGALRVPRSLARAAYDIARYNILTRVNLPVNESRARAWESARTLLEEVRRGAYAPEPDAGDAGDGGEPTRALPEADDGPPRTLGGGLW